MARCFVVKYGVSAGIPLEDHAVAVGESGRGRKLVTVRPPEGAEVTTDAQGQEVLVSVPGPGVVLLIRDHSGSRGGWRLAEYATARSEDGRIAGRELEPTEIGEVIASGWRAQGMTGGMGGGPEYLIRCPVGTKFSIRRSGRPYCVPAVLNVAVDEDDVIVTDAVRAIDEEAASQRW